MPDLDLGEEWNLVQTTTGDFHPRFIAVGKPPIGKDVVIATHGSTYGLRGIFAGSEAIVKIPAADKPYPV